MSDEEQVVRPARRPRGTLSPKIVVAIVIVVLVLASVASGFFVVDQTEQAVVLRLGRYERTVGPGLQLRLPFGIETSHNVPTQLVQTLTFGYRATDSTGTGLTGAQSYDDESVMLTGDHQKTAEAIRRQVGVDRAVAEVLPDGKEHPGIGAVLRGKAPFSEALTDSSIPDVDLKILYGGEPNSKDAALLGSRRMEKAIRAMEKQADYVILDTAPAELLADASLLGKYVDFVLYVVRCDYTKMSRIREGIEMLSMRDVNILGYIFNGDVRQKSSRYGYGYGYGYGRYGRYGGYSHYSHYGKLKNTGKREDSAGRVIKE